MSVPKLLPSVNRRFIDTARQGQCNGTASVRLSVPSVDRCHSVRRVCCCGPREQAISIDCCTARLQQARPLFGPYLQRRGGWQHGGINSKCEQCHVVSGRRKLNTDLLLRQLPDSCDVNTFTAFSSFSVLLCSILLLLLLLFFSPPAQSL